ncbi:MAG: cysS [Chlamydiia bacterium]|nr:cysS [Chlamydiia bacterium]
MPQFETSLQLVNTETRKKEEVRPLDGKVVRLYTCGPTVYDFAHIGNFRTFIFEDLLRRTIRFFGMKVIQVMNLTDIDDKTIRGALKNNLSLNEFTSQYKKAFFEDLKTLNIEPADHYPEATQYIPDMIEMIETLMKKGIAYTGADGSIYYAISKFPCYGKLSHLKLENLQAGASDRVAVDEYTKDHIADFVLWKAYERERDGKIFWESPFGKGRPGWHIECSVMAQKILGDEIDIHAGGVDLIFPHHENEIAQTEACTGKHFARLWVHAEHLLVDHKKMSKSAGNFYTLRDLLKIGFTGRAIRFLLLQTHYRVQMNFTMQALEGAKHSLQRIDDFIARLESYKPTKTGLTGSLKEYLDIALHSFTQALGDDLNTSEALAALFEMIRHVNSLHDREELTKDDVSEVLQLLARFDSILGLMNFEKEEVPAEVQALADLRKQARLEKNWKRSDELRAEIALKGYSVEDLPDGVRLKKI